MFLPPPHNQEILFDNKTRLVLKDVEKIELGNWTHIIANGGTEYIVNSERVLYVKVKSIKKHF